MYGEMIKDRIVEALKEQYDPESVCVYALEFKNKEWTKWRAEVEAYKDEEDGPYFFIFERDGGQLRYWFNDARLFPNSRQCLGAEIPPKEKES